VEVGVSEVLLRRAGEEMVTRDLGQFRWNALVDWCWEIVGVQLSMCPGKQ
jgi:hypothetical protein